MLLGIVKESAAGETRVALLPENTGSLYARRESTSRCRPERALRQVHQTLPTPKQAQRSHGGGPLCRPLMGADLLPVVNSLPITDQSKLKPSQGAVVVGFLRPLDAPGELTTAMARPATLFSMELVPRRSGVHNRWTLCRRWRRWPATRRW